MTKTLSAVALFAAVLAAPAAADVVHQTSVQHNGGTYAVSYVARTSTSLHQSGMGSRAGERCLWKSEVTVERQIVDASGRTIAALTRPVGKAKADMGSRTGYCAQLDDHHAAFGGNADKLKAFVAAAADADRHALHTEMASLGSLGRGASR